MKSAISVVSLIFLLLLLLTTAQGIRLAEQPIAAFHKENHEKESVMGGGSGGGAATPSKDDGLCSGEWPSMSRKLKTQRMARLKSERNDEGELSTMQKKHHHKSKEVDRDTENLNTNPHASEHKQLPAGTYPDVLDIAGMDYSPAKRKPPIHN